MEACVCVDKQFKDWNSHNVHIIGKTNEHMINSIDKSWSRLFQPIHCYTYLAIQTVR